MLRENGRFFLWTSLAALALRLFFFAYTPSIVDDSHVYANIASTWLQHGIYGQPEGDRIVPTDSRLPGYPAFLAAMFWIFGVGNFRAVLLAQVLLDVVTCFVIADLARRTVSARWAGPVAFALAATCPFLANYAAAVLTESLEIFFTALALDCAVAGLERMGDSAKTGSGVLPFWVATGAAIAMCILLRPDGGIVLMAVGLYFGILLVRRSSRKRVESIMVAGAIIAAVALAPLVPWTIRNLRTLHHFQPLAPRYATETDELAPIGFNRWAKTWIAEYVSVQEIYWNVPGDEIDVAKLPARALDEPPERSKTLDVIADYNKSQDLTPELDARFAELAAERIRAHPFRYYVVLPVLRILDMWLRPRTELLPPDPRWWEFNDERRESALAVGFGLLNLFYVVAAGVALLRKRAALRFIGLLGGFVLLRSLFLGTLENPEPRYTLECFPVLLVWAGACLTVTSRAAAATLISSSLPIMGDKISNNVS
jgi:4-amino-4-deoxy-L-arabinose transferase-like glycosyltransferase